MPPAGLLAAATLVAQIRNGASQPGLRRASIFAHSPGMKPALGSGAGQAAR